MYPTQPLVYLVPKMGLVIGKSILIIPSSLLHQIVGMRKRFTNRSLFLMANNGSCITTEEKHCWNKLVWLCWMVMICGPNKTFKGLGSHRLQTLDTLILCPFLSYQYLLLEMYAYRKYLIMCMSYMIIIKHMLYFSTLLLAWRTIY